MKNLVCVLALLFPASLGFAAGEKEVVIVAVGDQQKAGQNHDENAGARRARNLAALQKWASDNIMLTDRDMQLRAALAAKLYAQKGNRPFTAQEWQFFDQNTKWSVILCFPQAIPSELLDR